jgi:hypothetical protein
MGTARRAPTFNPKSKIENPKWPGFLANPAGGTYNDGSRPRVRAQQISILGVSLPQSGTRMAVLRRRMGNYLQIALGKIIGTKNQRGLKQLGARQLVSSGNIENPLVVELLGVGSAACS